MTLMNGIYIVFFGYKRDEWEWYLQFTFNVTVVSRRWPSAIARFQTTHRYLAPSSSRCGVIDNVLVVWRSFEPPRLIGAVNGIWLPSRYQLRNIEEENWFMYQIVWEERIDDNNHKFSNGWIMMIIWICNFPDFPLEFVFWMTRLNDCIHHYQFGHSILVRIERCMAIDRL